MRSYIKPTVRIASEMDTPMLPMYVWLKSRQWVITDEDGYKFMVDMIPTEDWWNEVPDKFYVSEELVSKFDYLHRIQKMNLQYNNMNNIVFEITGSCLFRDFLFNINKIGQWAMSNRFLFSILDEYARFDPQHYHISGEYKDIPEWEEQFDRYMQAIKDDPIVDHNRLEMPYSISSTFWISVNEKTLIDLLSYMKYKLPFFYEVYGKDMIDLASLCGITNIVDRLTPKISPTITQYIIKAKNWDTRSEGVTWVDDTCIVNSKMGLILYSQFIRQSDTKISGLFNELEHEDPEVFKHIVFKGSTTFDIHYVADYDKVMHTVSNRLCAFAMSSGDDPCSWSYFLNNFLPDNIEPEQLMDLLPCSYKDGKLCNCKFWDDVKFRNEGKEISNCPCPLVSLSMVDAQNKKDRDHNRIGDAYYKLTEYLINHKDD